jgi:diguanylate cyclase (GGDEF)-like protein/PAS domain S-box-containing protein
MPLETLELRHGNAIRRFLRQRHQIDARRDADLAITRAARLREVKALMASVFATSQDAILVVGENGAVMMCNAAATRLFGRGPELMTGASMDALLPGAAWQEKADGYREGIACDALGRAFPVEYAVTTVGTANALIRVVVLRDISERKSYEGSLQHQATHDPLTGLPNRTLLAQVVEERLAAAGDGRFALLLLDLDRFKEINDTLGHDIGDELLCRLAARLTEAPIGFICRLGGDEFALVMPSVRDAGEAEEAAAALAARIEEPVVLRDMSLTVAASIGIALWPDHAATVKDLLRCADVAMYAAKHRRCRAAVYDAAADRNSIRQLTLSGELRRAVESNVMTLEYQPKLSLTGAGSHGAEALLRWTHPTLGAVSPAEFVPQAEQTGLIAALTTHTLETAIAQIAAWRGAGLSLSVAVNLSAQVIHDPKLPQRVNDLLARHEVPAALLTLEITESAIMHDPDSALAVAHQLSEIGVHLSIDDFGTGYSSLAYLSRLPCQEVKIDRSFVSRMLASPTDLTIVRSTIDLAHSLGMAVVAEGIDRVEILQRLVPLGCDYGQGFLLARPTRPEQLPAVIAAMARTREEWGIGPGGVAPDTLAPRQAAMAERVRAAAERERLGRTLA